jgi:hypothetical protein
MFCTTSSTWKFVVVLGLSVAVPELSFSLGADVQIQGCREKNCSYHVCVFLVNKFSTNATSKHQFLSQLAPRVILLHRHISSMVNRLLYVGAVLRARIKTGYAVPGVPLFVHTHVTTHLVGPF